MRPCLIHHLLEESCARHPDKICLVHHDHVQTYRQTLAQSRTLQTALSRCGLQPHEPVGLLLDHSLELVNAIFAVLLARGVFVIINPILKPEQAAHIVRDCRIRTLITAPTTVAPFATTLKEAGITTHVLVRHGPASGLTREIHLDPTPSDPIPSPPTAENITDDPSHIIYTSGSTGWPKGIVVSHRNTIDGARIVSSYLGLRPDDRLISVLPLNFDYGLNQLINCVYLGATLILHRFFMPNDLLNLLEREKITVFAGMGPIWLELFNPKTSNPTQKRDFSSLRVITNSGGSLAVPLVQRLRQLFADSRLFLMYGLTEAFRSTYLDPDQLDQRPDSIGKAIPGVEIIVIHASGRRCLPGEEGELVHRGALITKGYWNQPEATRQVFRPHPLLDPDNAHLETVVFSGDTVRMDAEGFLYYVGRRDLMIKTKGYRVSPTEVESLILALEGIGGCVATGYAADDKINLRVFVTFTSPDMDRQRLTLLCRQTLPFYLRPDDIVVVDRFPLTANGKIDRNRIINDYHPASTPPQDSAHG
ncbi:MAG: AMP-binding protein [Magnetococcales bacterium]|nr:AMP-binding protein [Magnetococcales bacterium]